MKLIFVLAAFVPFLAFAEAPPAAPKGDPCQNGKVYRHCDDQEQLYNQALAKAKREKKTLIVALGADWCPWCVALHTYFTSPTFGHGFAKTYFPADIALYLGKEKLPTGQIVVEKLKRQAGYTAPIAGIPMIALVNPKNGKAVMLDPQNCEKNTKTTKGYDPAKLWDTIEKARASLK